MNFNLELAKRDESMKNENFVGDAVTVETFKSMAGCDVFEIHESKTQKNKKSGAAVSYFICGDYSGLVSDSLAAKIWAGKEHGTILIQEVIGSDGQHRITAFEKGGKCVVL